MKVILLFFWMVLFFIPMPKCGDEVVKEKTESINSPALAERHFAPQTKKPFNGEAGLVTS